MEVEDTEENQDPLPSTSEQGTSLNINFIKLEPVFQSETVDKPHPVIIKSEPPVKFESVKSEPTYSSDDEVLEEVEPQYVDQTDIKEEFTVVEEESVDLDDDVKEEIEIDAVDGSVQDPLLPETVNSTQTNENPKGYQRHPTILRKKTWPDFIQMYECPYCKKMFWTYSEVENHIASIHTPEIHKCDPCNYVTGNIRFFKRHLAIKHSKTKRYKRIVCVFCNEPFETKQNLDSHLLKWHANILGDDLNKTAFILYTCNFCIYQTVRLEDYQRHLSYHERNPGKFKCETCGHEGSDRRNFHCHLESHFGTNLFRCIFCQKEFSILLDYQAHLLNNHKRQVENLKEVMTHKCTECSYETFVVHSFQRHIATHGLSSPVKKHQNLVENLQEIMTLEIHKCTECSYETVSLCNFNRHVATHPAKKDLCAECGFQTVHLKNHIMRMHSDVKQFLCSECSESFHQKRFLDNHILEAHSDNQELRDMVTRRFFECDKCSFQTVFMRNLVKHRNSHHQIVKVSSSCT